MVLQLCPTPIMSFRLQSNHLGMNARTATRNSHRLYLLLGAWCVSPFNCQALPHDLAN